MVKTFKSIKEIIREQRIRNILEDTKTSVYEEVFEEADLEPAYK